MSEFAVLDCIIRDSGGLSNDFEDRSGFQGESNGNWNNGGFDVLSASLHDSGILSSNSLQDSNDVSFNEIIKMSYIYFIRIHIYYRDKRKFLLMYFFH